ncbi:MAG TPA: DUF1345 domain-containing protein [Pseudonocardiaceae bacterium]|nr:DUF1345 domain-containing protein [Pseudonocardiaceae bacterium]
MRVLQRSGYRVAEIVLVLLGIGWLAIPDQYAVVWLFLLIAWDVVAFLYCLARWLRVRRHRTDVDEPGEGPPDWLHSVLGRRSGLAATVLVSLVGMSAGVLILVARGLPQTGDAQVASVVLQVLGVPAVIMAWLLLHFGFADRYAHLYYELAPAPALAFPETERPNLLDFAYFSFTIGSSFAASDVEVRSRVLRYTLLTHSVVSFFYNAAILSIAIGVITGI